MEGALCTAPMPGYYFLTLDAFIFEAEDIAIVLFPVRPAACVKFCMNRLGKWLSSLEATAFFYDTLPTLLVAR